MTEIEEKSRKENIKDKLGAVKSYEWPFWRWLFSSAKGLITDTRVAFYIGIFLAIAGVGALAASILLAIEYSITKEVVQVLALGVLGAIVALHGYYRDRIRKVG